ncbi:MAG: CHAT domain-containing tetratricopeptide repeat protein [Acidimicrobiales bacterium]
MSGTEPVLDDEARAALLRVGDATDAAAVQAELAGRGLLSEAGVARLVETARHALYDDPAAGAHLARLAHTAATAADLRTALPAATYLLAQATVQNGDLHDALGLLDAARDGFEANGSLAAALRTNLGRTHVLNELGRHEEALTASRAILLAADDATTGMAVDEELAAAAEQNSGLCLELMGRFDEALAAYGRAEARFAQSGSGRAMAEVAFDRALVLLTLGRHGEALAVLGRSAVTFRDEGFRLRLAETLTQMAEVHLQRGELHRCLTTLDEAREALQSIGAPVGDHQRLLVAGRAYLALSLLPEAIASFAEAVDFLDATDLVVEQARARWGGGLALAASGRHDEADRSLEVALQRFRRSGHNGWVAAVLVDRARLALRRREPAAARTAAEEALVLARHSGAAVTAVQALLVLADLTDPTDPTNLADAADATGGAGRDALAHLEQARTEAEALGLDPLTAAVHHALGRRLAHSGRTEEALPLLRSAVDAVERARGGLGQDALLRRYLDDKRSPYEDLLAVLIDGGASVHAMVELCDRSRSRALSELRADLRARSPEERRERDGSGPAGLPADAEEAAVLADLRAAQSELFAPTPVAEPRRTILADRLAELERRAGLLAVRRSERAVRRDTSRAVDATTTATTGAATAALDGPTIDATVLSYACANGVVHAFVIDGDTPSVVPSCCRVEEVDALLQRLETQFSRLAAGGARLDRHLVQQRRATDAVLARLHELLIAPVAALLPSGPGPQPLVIVPDGPLAGVPFSALADGAAPLLDRFVISLAPSISALGSTSVAAPPGALVAGVADELAPLVADEVRAVGERLPAATVLVDEAATWDRVVQALPAAGHVHLAGHAVFRPDNAMYSALRLADRWVTAAELLQLDLGGRTVVLSACDTARTDLATAEVLGFTRALLGAGAATAVASLWAADDRATTTFMRCFYAELGAIGPVAALRGAQRVVAEEHPHPYHWAPWVLFGRR